MNGSQRDSKQQVVTAGEAFRRIVPVKEFLKEVPIGREAAYRAFKDGRLPCLKFGRKILVDIEECLQAMRGKN